MPPYEFAQKKTCWHNVRSGGIPLPLLYFIFTLRPAEMSAGHREVRLLFLDDFFVPQAFVPRIQFLGGVRNCAKNKEDEKQALKNKNSNKNTL